MKRFLSLFIAVIMLMSLFGIATHAENDALINIEVLDVGFCKETTIGYVQSRTYETDNGINSENIFHNIIGQYPDEGNILFVIQANISNISDHAVTDEDLTGSVEFPGKDSGRLKTYAYGDLTAAALPAPSETVPAILVCHVSEVYAEAFDGCTVLVGGASLSYSKDEIEVKERIAFPNPDDITTVDGVSISTPAKEQRPSNAADMKEAEAPHVDELTIEGVSFQHYTNIAYGQYIMSVNVRNNCIPEIKGSDLLNVVINFQLLDASGDGLPVETNHIDSFDVLPSLKQGQAAWVENFNNYLSKEKVDCAESISFTSYELRYGPDEYGDWKQIEGKFSELPTFRMADIIPKGEEAFLIDNVSVEFTDVLPVSVIRSSEYIAGITRFDYSLEDSETYAAISFSLTNLTKQNVVLTEDWDTVIELNFNDGFIYSTATESKKPHIFQVGRETAVLHSTSRIGGEVVIPPLVTYDVMLYLPCAELVGTLTDRPLVLTVRTLQPGYAPCDVQIR